MINATETTLAIREVTMSNTTETATVLVIGATGQTGRLIVQELERDPGATQVRISSRRKDQVEQLRTEGRDAVYLDLDDPLTFPAALEGVDRLYLLTGYTVAMLVQSKTIVDAAKKAGVQHIVHQGVFSDWDTTDPHFAWHEMIERYIEASGIAWTHLHPNIFMEAMIGTFSIRNDIFPWYMGEPRVGWVALKDLATVAATVLREGSQRHGGQNYWLSVESLNATEVASILSDVLDRQIRHELKQPSDLLKDFQESTC